MSRNAARTSAHATLPIDRLSIQAGIAMEVNVPLLARANHPEVWRSTLTTLRTLTDGVAEAKDSVEQLGRSAGRKLDDAREETGDALHSAAASVRATGRRGSDAIDSLATGAADRLDATASYVEDHDLSDVFTSLRRFGRRHLTALAVAAAAIGFVAGTVLCRATHARGRAPGGSE
jgi:ElaB/YqjD/DUF883 family membrane-anchored ribosome-binding protein